MSSGSSSSVLGPDLRSALVAMVRKRVPESEVEDIVQSALAEAVTSPNAPADSEALRRWIFGVAKNKVVDYHRRSGRESFDLPDVEGEPAPHVEADLLRWAEKNLPPGEDAKETLRWMLREGDGEKLESIASSEKVPAPRVRQRVSRLRRHFKTHWQREVAVLAALGVLISIAVGLWLKNRDKPEPIAHDPEEKLLVPQGEKLRKEALERCAAHEWRRCLDGLDDAKRFDPAGDTSPSVQRVREEAKKALETTAVPPEDAPRITPPPSKSDALPTPSPSGTTTTLAPPAPTPTPSPMFSGKTEVAPPTKPVGKSASLGDLSSEPTPPSGFGDAKASEQKDSLPTQKKAAPKPVSKASKMIGPSGF